MCINECSLQIKLCAISKKIIRTEESENATVFLSFFLFHFGFKIVDRFMMIRFIFFCIYRPQKQKRRWRVFVLIFLVLSVYIFVSFFFFFVYVSSNCYLLVFSFIFVICFTVDQYRLNFDGRILLIFKDTYFQKS